MVTVTCMNDQTRNQENMKLFKIIRTSSDQDEDYDDWKDTEEYWTDEQGNKLICEDLEL